MNKERLLKLAAHLRQEKLPIEWNFNISLNHCGTAGCALGNLPFVWPESFPLQRVLDGLWRTQYLFDLFDIAQDWFDIRRYEANALFNNGSGERGQMEFPHQSEDLTPLQVAENIEWFVEHGAKDEWCQG